MSINRNRHSQPASLPLPVSNAAAYVSRLSACNVARILAHGCAYVCSSTRAFARASMQHVRVPRVLHDDHTYALLFAILGNSHRTGAHVQKTRRSTAKPPHVAKRDVQSERYGYGLVIVLSLTVPPLCGTLFRGRRQRLQSAQRYRSYEF